MRIPMLVWIWNEWGYRKLKRVRRAPNGKQFILYWPTRIPILPNGALNDYCKEWVKWTPFWR